MKIYLDLLPQEMKQEINRKKTFRKILFGEALFLLPLLVFISIIINVYYLLTLQRDAAMAAQSAEQAQNQYQQLGKYEDKFKQVNATSNALVKIQEGQLNWKNLFVELNNVVPDGVILSNISTKNYQVFLLGKAKTRDILLDFKNKLESSQCFSDINVPLSNLVVKEDIDFQLDFIITQDCLKKN